MRSGGYKVRLCFRQKGIKMNGGRREGRQKIRLKESREGGKREGEEEALAAVI